MNKKEIMVKNLFIVLKRVNSLLESPPNNLDSMAIIPSATLSNSFYKPRYEATFLIKSFISYDPIVLQTQHKLSM